MSEWQNNSSATPSILSHFFYCPHCLPFPLSMPPPYPLLPMPFTLPLLFNFPCPILHYANTLPLAYPLPFVYHSYHYPLLFYNTCSFCIFIGRELCVIKVHTHGWRQLMSWSNLANLFRGSSHDFCQLYYNIKQIDFSFLGFCTVIDHRWRHSVWRTKSHALDCVSCILFCSSHAMTSSVIYYSTDARKNEIYLLNTKWRSLYKNY